MKQGQTRAQSNRAIRQEALREQLSSQGHVQHVIKILGKIEALNAVDSTFSNDLAKYKVANEQRMKLVNKYLPDLKLQELVGADGGSIEMSGKWTIEVVNA